MNQGSGKDKNHISGVCRDCQAEWQDRLPLCPVCGGGRLVHHQATVEPEIAHIDCDAFYASVEKRDHPELLDKAVVIGGGKRGVVATACYVARLYGIKSAMPIFQAKKLCPDAIFMFPDMKKYRKTSEQIQKIMTSYTPLVQPVSIDEAFLDLSGTSRLHGAGPVGTLNRLIAEIEDASGITVSAGLAPNKFLAKLASDMDKPRGFSVIGFEEARGFLHDKSVAILPGVGKSLATRLKRDGLHRICELKKLDEIALTKRYGTMGRQLYQLSRGHDDSSVSATRDMKSISAETTFEKNTRATGFLKQQLWPLCETVSKRAKNAGYAGQTVTLKLKTDDFKLITRAHSLPMGTQMAEQIYKTSLHMLTREIANKERSFRLIGVGLSSLIAPKTADMPDLADYDQSRQYALERAMDHIRERLGEKSVMKGRSLHFKKE